jgi:ribosomal protein S18 acetylase RimI-like enzyme
MTTEIRRIKEGEGETVAALWDEQARTEPDGAPLPPRGRLNIARMLDMAAWHEQQLCLVAVEDERIVGFVCASIDAGSGLLPGLVGEIDALYVTPAARDKGVSGRLAQKMVEQLGKRGSGTIRSLVCVENSDAQAFWQAQGFERDMVCMSLYRNG